jgi:hypothetical protein
MGIMPRETLDKNFRQPNFSTMKTYCRQGDYGVLSSSHTDNDSRN